MNIVSMAFRLTAAVAEYCVQARQYFYETMLSDHGCPDCGGVLKMTGESRCRCAACGHTFDPTIAFQRCTDCGGVPRIQARHYGCGDCGGDITSRFLFDGLAFDAEYFRRKMAEHRNRKALRSERARQIVEMNRSGSLESEPADLGAAPGLIQALDDLTAGAELDFRRLERSSFDLARYQSHIEAHIQTIPIMFDRIPPLEKDPRKDRIWRFVTLIFMAHVGLVALDQQDQTIQVIRCETH